MSRPLVATTLALMVAIAPIAFAQTVSPTPTTPPAERTAMTNPAPRDSFTTIGGELRASKIIGSTVYDEQNQNVGSVKDVLLDRSGNVRSVVVDVGAFLGMGGKFVTVPLNDFKTDHDRLTLNKTKGQLKAAPEFHFQNS
jgi:sporulation protein YlmC with PRC-barrel domain